MIDVLIIGGGLAGLTNAILLKKAGLKVALFEKNQYPFHRVCGEYISNETLDFFKNELEIDPFQYGAVSLNEFQLTSPKGNSIILPLDLGGFGISRYLLDDILYQKALALGVEVHTNNHILEVTESEGCSLIKNNRGETYEGKMVIGSFGKRSNLDNFWRRAFFTKKSPYIGVKYHIKFPRHPIQRISLHNFKNGYCGISRIEDDKYCLCYLTTRQNLKDYGKIEELEKKLLQKNPFLDQIFTEAEFIWDQPKVINEISFASKSQLKDDIFFCGDSAGLIAPLAGNGMAIALHSAKILSSQIIEFYHEHISREQLIKQYQRLWNKQFSFRLAYGRKLQYFFGNPFLTEALLWTAKKSRAFSNILIRQTHGQVF
jgi:menaquinone-9 beta-reductase